MSQEKEIKIILKKLPLNKFIKRIVKKGFVKEKQVSQTDIYFDTPDWYLYENLAALRLRVVNNKDHSFSFKKLFYRPNNKDKYFIEEIETHFPFKESDKLMEIFNKIGIVYNGQNFKSGKEITSFLKKQKYSDDQKMSKLRQVFKKECDEIVIDDVDRVGVIIELECKENEPLEIVKEVLDDSEWERSIEGTSYIWLKNVKGLSSHIKNLERFKTEPDWNVWEIEKEMYKTICV